MVAILQETIHIAQHSMAEHIYIYVSAGRNFNISSKTYWCFKRMFNLCLRLTWVELKCPPTIKESAAISLKAHKKQVKTHDKTHSKTQVKTHDKRQGKHTVL